MASPAQYRFSVKHKTNDTNAPYGGMKFVTTMAIDFETALSNAQLALEAAGFTVVGQEAYDLAVEAGDDVDLQTYLVSIELKDLVTPAVA